MRTYRMYVLIVAQTCYLCACGTKGPLYIPEQRYPQASATKPDSLPKVDSKNNPDAQKSGQ